MEATRAVIRGPRPLASAEEESIFGSEAELKRTIFVCTRIGKAEFCKTGPQQLPFHDLVCLFDLNLILML
jgi:hypothetical protein